MRTEDAATMRDLLVAQHYAPNRRQRRAVTKMTMACPACGIRILAKNGARHAEHCPKLTARP